MSYLRITLLLLLLLSLLIEVCLRIRISTIPGLTLRFFSIYFIIIFLTIGNQIEKKPVIAKNNLNIPIVVFVFVCFLSLFITYTFKLVPDYRFIKEMRYFRLYMEHFIILLIVYNLIHDEASVKFVLFSLLLYFFMINVLTVLGSYEIITVGDIEMEKGTRSSGAFGDANQYAAFNALFIPLGIAFFLGSKSFSMKVLMLAIVSLGIFCILLTGSRGGIVALFVGINVVLISSKKQISFSYLFKIFLFWAVFALLFISALYMLPEKSRQGLHDNVIGRAIDEDVQSEYRADYTSGRTRLWKQALVIFSKSPLIGSGWRTYRLFVNNNTHNDYLLFLSDTGIVGFTSFLFIFYQLYISVKMMKKRYKGLSIYFNGYSGGLIAFMTAMFFQNMFTVYIFFFLYSGLILKLGDIQTDMKMAS